MGVRARMVFAGLGCGANGTDVLILEELLDIEEDEEAILEFADASDEFRIDGADHAGGGLDDAAVDAKNFVNTINDEANDAAKNFDDDNAV